MRDLDGARLFLKIVDLGSLSAAGRSLGLPHSTVSRRLARMEAELGACLVQRSSRSLALTEAGHLVHRAFGRLIETQAALEEELQADEPRGVLRVSVSHAFATEMVAPILPSFRDLHPGVRVALDVTGRTVDLVAEGYDLAIRNGMTADTSLIGRRLGATPFILCASPGYLDGAPPLSRVADIAGHAVLAFNHQEEQPRTWTLRRGDARVSVEIAPRVYANDLAVLRRAAEAGMGLACLPARLCRDALREGRLRHCLPDWDQGEAQTFALYPSRRALGAKARAFIDHMVKHVEFAR